MHAFAALLGAALAAFGLVWIIAEGVEAFLAWRHELSKVVKFRPKSTTRTGQVLPDGPDADIVDLERRLKARRNRRLGIVVDDEEPPAA